MKVDETGVGGVRIGIRISLTIIRVVGSLLRRESAVSYLNPMGMKGTYQVRSPYTIKHVHLVSSFHLLLHLYYPLIHWFCSHLQLYPLS